MLPVKYTQTMWLTITTQTRWQPGFIISTSRSHAFTTAPNELIHEVSRWLTTPSIKNCKSTGHTPTTSRSTSTATTRHPSPSTHTSSDSMRRRTLRPRFDLYMGRSFCPSSHAVLRRHLTMTTLSVLTSLLAGKNKCFVYWLGESTSCDKKWFHQKVHVCHVCM